MSSNEKTISFRAVAEKIEALDSLAAAQQHPRSYLINEAITNYIDLVRALSNLFKNAAKWDWSNRVCFLRR